MNKIILIIGGSSGLGFSLAKEFGLKNKSIVISSSNKKKLINAKIQLEKYKIDTNYINAWHKLYKLN